MLFIFILKKKSSVCDTFSSSQSLSFILDGMDSVT